MKNVTAGWIPSRALFPFIANQFLREINIDLAELEVKWTGTSVTGHGLGADSSQVYKNQSFVNVTN